MGLTPDKQSGTLVAPRPKGIIDPYDRQADRLATTAFFGEHEQRAVRQGFHSSPRRRS